MAHDLENLKPIGGQNNIHKGGDLFSYNDTAGDGLDAILADDFFLDAFQLLNVGDIININHATGIEQVTVLTSIESSVIIRGLNGSTEGLTADTGSIQGGLPITSNIWEVFIVGTAGDSTTLPIATRGRIIYVINAAAANSMDVFPALNGFISNLTVNTALALPAGTSCVFVGYSELHWMSILGN
jgi:hypothetical protein